jgi:hypothetical protein
MVCQSHSAGKKQIKKKSRIKPSSSDANQIFYPRRLGPKQTSVLVPIMGITKLINIIPVPILMMKIVISAEHNAIATLTKQNSVNKRNHKGSIYKIYNHEK